MLGNPGLVRLFVKPLRKLEAPVGSDSPLRSPELPGVRLDSKESTMPRLGNDVVAPSRPDGPPAPRGKFWDPLTILPVSNCERRGSFRLRGLCKLCVDRSKPVIRELDDAAAKGFDGDGRLTPAKFNEAAKSLGYDEDPGPPVPVVPEVMPD